MAGTNKLAGRLWGGDASSSESSSSDSDDDQPQVQAAEANKKRVVWADTSSSEDEAVTKRKVVSHTDKRYTQMKDSIKLMKNHQKVNDFSLLVTDYESLVKMLDKIKVLIEQDGGPPGFFIKAICGMEIYCEKLHAEHIENKANKGQRLPENKQKAFNTLRAKVRKGNKNWQDLIEKCKEDPSQFDAAQDEEEKDDASESSDESEQDSSSSSGSSDSSSSDSESGSGSDSDSDSDSGSDSDSSSDSDSAAGTDETSEDEGDKEAVRERKMLRWLITPEQADKQAAKDKIKAEQGAGAAQKDKRGKGKNKEPKTKNNNKEAKDKEPGTKEKEEFTPEQLVQKVTEIAQTRGRRQYVRKDYMEKLAALEEHAVKQGPCAQLYILTSMISGDFDNTGRAFEAMKIGTWNEAREKVLRMLPLLAQSCEELKEGKVEESTDEEDPTSHSRLQGLFTTYVERLDDELFKALQLTPDLYGAEYQEILANSSKFLVLVKRVHKFFEDTNQVQPLGLISLRLMEQLYYKPDMLNKAVFEAIRKEVPEDQKDDWVWPEDSTAYMSKLCRYVFPNGKPIRARAADPADPDADPAEGNSQARLHRRASLCQAYHLALHENFQAARDLVYLGNLHDLAQGADVHTQILFNRVLAQLGLCAFRLGKIQDAHTFLSDCCQHNKARELLAQGLSYSKFNDKTPEQERDEKLRQLPYHMHINTDVLESAHYISAMLLEIPNMAMQGINPSNQRQISRVLRRTLEHYDKQYFIGPPENTREAVYSAAKALQQGEWQGAFEALEALKFWDHVDPGDPDSGSKIKAMIKEKVQIEALRTYLFAFNSIYDAFHLDQLVGMFGLDPKTVHSTVSKMMLREEITAFWDESSKYVLVQHSEPTPLQRLALTLADRGAQAVENNERLVDSKSGGYGFNVRDPRQQQGQMGSGKGDGRFGKGGGKGMDGKGAKGKGRGKGAARPAVNRGWENARAGALRGSAQRGWATTTTAPSSRFSQ